LVTTEKPGDVGVDIVRLVAGLAVATQHTALPVGDGREGHRREVLASRR
jgi:hypothetical protein